MRALLLWCALALAAPVLSAQCVMCRESAAYQKERAVEALNAGILLLGIPPALILGGVGFLLYRYRDGAVKYLPSDHAPNIRTRYP